MVVRFIPLVTDKRSSLFLHPVPVSDCRFYAQNEHRSVIRRVICMFLLYLHAIIQNLPSLILFLSCLGLRNWNGYEWHPSESDNPVQKARSWKREENEVRRMDYMISEGTRIVVSELALQVLVLLNWDFCHP